METMKETQLTLPFPHLYCGCKGVKKMLVKIGFHHSWGYWILNTNHSSNVTIRKNKISVTKGGNYYYATDDIRFKEKTIDEVETRIKKYFNISI